MFTAHNDIDRVIARDTFDKKVNNILTKASILVEKHLRNYSFRATFVTDLLEYAPIEDLKQLLVYKDINTTLEYKRSTLQPREIDRILKKRRLLNTREKKYSTKLSKKTGLKEFFYKGN